MDTNEFITMFDESIKDAAVFASRHANYYMVYSTRDYTPFKTNGREISLIGHRIWTGTREQAYELAQALDEKARHTPGSNMRVVSGPVVPWSVNRVAVLRDLKQAIMQKCN